MEKLNEWCMMFNPTTAQIEVNRNNQIQKKKNETQTQLSKREF